MPHAIHTHETNDANRQLHLVAVCDERSEDRHYRYDVTGYDSHGNSAACNAEGYESHHTRTILLFQNGPIKEVGVNGITNEVLLAVLIDRLEGFQSGPFACPENKLALLHLKSALNALEIRTTSRTARGVEGTHKK